VSRWNTNSSKTAERWPRGNPKIRNPRERSRAFKLDALRNLGVDLTAYLTQSRANWVIELRGGGYAIAGWHTPEAGKANRDATDRGHALHAMFETIEWIEDFEPDDEALRAAARAAAPRRDDAWLDARVAEFREAIASPNVRQTLSRPAGADSGGPALRADDGGPALRADDQGGSALRADARVYREHRFVRPVGDELQRGAIDRLVAHYQDGRCTASRVIDFKTDAITPQRAAHAAEAYRPQIDAYRAAAAAFLRVDAGLVEGSVVFIVPGVVVDLGAPPTDEASS